MTQAKHHFTKKEFSNIISGVWLRATNQDLRNYVDAVKEDLLNGANYEDRKSQQHILSRCWTKAGSTDREFIETFKDQLMEWEG